MKHSSTTEMLETVSKKVQEWADASQLTPKPFSFELKTTLHTESGVYVRRYADGTWYVGKAKDVSNRLCTPKHKEKVAEHGEPETWIFYMVDYWMELIERAVAEVLRDEVELLNVRSLFSDGQSLRRAKSQRYKERNRERLNAWQKEYYQSHREEKAAYDKQYRERKISSKHA